MVLSPQLYTIKVITIGSKPWSLTYADNTTETVQGPDNWPSSGDSGVEMPAASGNAFVFGFFDASGGYQDAPNWRIFEHELCGHIWAGGGSGTSGCRPEHDDAIKTENEIAVEHGAVERGTFSTTFQGESTWRAVNGNVCYFKNCEGIDPATIRDYKMTIAP